MKTATSHPTFEQLLDYVEGKLPPAPQKQVQQHLDAGCPTCRTQIVWLNHNLTLLSQDEWKEPPAALQTAARQAFSRPPAQTRPARSPSSPRRFRPQSRLLFGSYAILIIFLLSGLLFVLEPAFVPARANTSVSLEGNVEVQPNGDDEWQTAPTTYNPRSGDLVRTKGASTATLSFFGRTVTRLDAHTAVAVTALRNSVTSGDSFVVLHQWEGQTENSVGLESYTQSQLIIQTPAVLITGETANFMTNVARNGDTTIFVRQGQVKVTAEGVTTTIMAGEAARILVGTPPVTIALNASPTPSPTPSPPATLSPNVLPSSTPGSPAEDNIPAAATPDIPPTYTPFAPNNNSDESPASQDPPSSQGNNGVNPPGLETTPPGQGNDGSPPGQQDTPPGQDNGGNPSGQDNSSSNQPPGQNRP